MEQLINDVGGGVRLVLPIALFILFGGMAAFSFMGATFKQVLLSQDRDGWRLFMLGCGLVVLALLAKTGTNTVAFAAFGATLIVLGGVIWANDRLTDVLLKPYLGWAYFIIAAATFAYGAFWGAEVVAFNAIGLTALVVPVGSAVLFGSLAAFALLSEEFKQRILPQNADGGRLMGLGAAFLIVGMFSSNPITLVAATTYSATVVVLGGLVQVEDKYTNLLLKAWMAPMYLLFAIALFTRAADFFTSAVVSSVVLLLIALILSVSGTAGFLKSTTMDKPTFKGFAPPIVYTVAALLLLVAAIADLLIK